MPPARRGEEMNGSRSGLPETPDKGPWSENPLIHRSANVTLDRQADVTLPGHDLYFVAPSIPHHVAKLAEKALIRG